MSERNLYEVTGDIKDINTLLVSREEWNRRAQPVQAAPPAEQQIEVACEAVAGALGDAYDCGRHWSAWSYGTMGPDDFSQVSEDDDRVREITLAALGAVGLKVTP